MGAQLLPGRRRARLSRALSKHRVRGARHSNASALAILLPARRMVYLAADLDRVHPHKVVRILGPLGLKVLLADWARRVGERDVLWNKNISILCLLLDPPSSPRRAIGCVLWRCLVDLAILNPLLETCQQTFICWMWLSYLLREVPAPMNTALGSIGVLHFEVPVHVTGLLLSALWRRIKSSPARSADVGLCIVQTGDEMQTWSVDTVSKVHLNGQPARGLTASSMQSSIQSRCGH